MISRQLWLLIHRLAYSYTMLINQDKRHVFVRASDCRSTRDLTYATAPTCNQ